MTSVSFHSISKAFKRKIALDRFDLVVESESFTVLCGPPNAGKSVLCRLLVGLEMPDAGRIELGGQDITRVPAAMRPIGYVPQSFALYPHLSVYDNIAYPLSLSRVAKDEIARRVDRAASMLSIGHLLKKTPDQLSGGEKQRTAVARGLLKNANVFVLDDPLAGLDYKLRERLMDELKMLREEVKATFLYATSDSLEALTMAQCLAVVDAGRLIQQGNPIRVYDEPSSLRALELIGFPQANVLRGVVSNGEVAVGPLRFPAPRGLPDGPVAVGLRPEAIKPESTLPAPSVQAKGIGRVRLVENLGGEFVVYIDVHGQMLTMSFPVQDHPVPVFESDMAFTIDARDVILFNPVDGRRHTGGA